MPRSVQGSAEVLLRSPRSAPAPVALAAPSLSKSDLYEGRRGASARASLIDLARQIEQGQRPFGKSSAASCAAQVSELGQLLTQAQRAKPSRDEILLRSAALTALLGLGTARHASAETRAKAVSLYVEAMGSERHRPLRMSLSAGLISTKLRFPAALQPTVDRVRAELLPASLDYRQMFSGPNPKLNVVHYVMDEFWKANLRAYKARGFTIQHQSAKEVSLIKKLVDPSGKQPTISARVTLKLDDQNIFRDMSDPKVQLVIYSGHSQLGGVVESSLTTAPRQVAGFKALLLYNCRGFQTGADVRSALPGVQMVSTASSAYDDDDTQMLSAYYEMIARRGDYASLRSKLRGLELIGGAKNYILPDDLRTIDARDDDQDAQPDRGPIPDRFFDPGRHRPKSGRSDMTPRASRKNPDDLSAEKVSRAIGYANTSLFYFAEANRAAPVAMKETDRLVPMGWFKSDSEDLLRIVPVQRDGKTYYQVSMNTRYADQDSDALALMAIREVHRFLAIAHNGKYTATDKLRTAMLAGEYVSLYVPYLEDCQRMMACFGEKYGYRGLTWEAYDAATKKDGEEGMGSAKALEALKKAHVSAGVIGR